MILRDSDFVLVLLEEKSNGMLVMERRKVSPTFYRDLLTYLQNNWCDLLQNHLKQNRHW